MIEREDLKIGDVIYVNREGQQTGNKRDIKVTIDEEVFHNLAMCGKVRAMLGSCDKFKGIGLGKWSSDYIIVD